MLWPAAVKDRGIRMVCSFGIGGGFRSRVGAGWVGVALGGLLGGGSLAVAAPAAAAGPVPAARATPNVPTVGIHDGAINGCDGGGNDGSGQQPVYSAATSSFDSRYFGTKQTGLRVGTVRFSPSWDVAYHNQAYASNPAAPGNKALEVEQRCLDAWLAGAQKHGLQPEIAFKPDYNYLTPDRKHIAVPDIRTYRAAMDAFTALYSNCTAYGGTATSCNLPPEPAGFPPNPGGMARVRIIAPWGEPDFNEKGLAGFSHLPQKFAMPKSGGSGTFGRANCHNSFTVDACGPVLAAQMWVAVSNSCKAACYLPKGTGRLHTVIGGDFSGGGGNRTDGGRQSYLVTYAKFLKNLTGPPKTYRPAVWGVHPYGDIFGIETYDAKVRNHLAARKPVLKYTATAKFAENLRDLHYGTNTEIWLNEITVFYQKYMNGKVQHPTWTRAVQTDAARYLLDTLGRIGRPGEVTTRGEPVVTRIYYLNYAAGSAAHPTSFTYQALVVNGKPVGAYHVFANRPRHS